MAEQDLQRAFGAASTANKAASLGGAGVPYLDFGLGLARLFANPSGEDALRFVGQTATSPQAAQLAASALGSSGVPAAWSAGQAAVLADLGVTAGTTGASLAAGAAALPFSMFAGGGPFKMLLSDQESSDTQRRRYHRTADAGNLQGQTLRGLFEDRNLRSPVGDSTVGDAMLAILNNNLNGTYYTDTGHGWLPDYTLAPLRDRLTGMGFTGKEPTRNDVGGVGEMIAGGGMFLPPEERAYSRATESSTGAPLSYDLAAGSRGGPVGWDRLLRGLSGVSQDAPRPFDQMSGYGAAPKMVERDSGTGATGFFNAPEDAVSPEYVSGLASVMGDDFATRIKNAAEDRKRNFQESAIAGSSAGGG